jgi:hypothetical protein
LIATWAFTWLYGQWFNRLIEVNVERKPAYVHWFDNYQYFGSQTRATTTHWHLETTKRFEVCLVDVDLVAINYAFTGLLVYLDLNQPKTRI